MPIPAGPGMDPKCFIAMPVRTRKTEAETYGDPEHWKHVMEELFVPAIKAAGYEPVIPVTSGAYLIHAQIVKHLSESDLVLCDLSAYNPNVFFELGVRTSLNLPIALVSDGLADLPFDTSGINTHTYGPKLNAWDIVADREKLTAHIVASADSCKGANPMWQQFGLSLKAQEPHSDANPLEAKVDLLSQHVEQLVSEQHYRVPTRVAERLRMQDREYPFAKNGDSGARSFAERVRFLSSLEEFPVVLVVDESRGAVTISPVSDGATFPPGFEARVHAIAAAHGVMYKFGRNPADGSVNYTAPDIPWTIPTVEEFLQGPSNDEDQ